MLSWYVVMILKGPLKKSRLPLGVVTVMYTVQFSSLGFLRQWETTHYSIMLWHKLKPVEKQTFDLLQY